MNLRTFGQLKAAIARVCGVSGMPVTDPRVMEFTNLAVEEILNEGDFPWTVERLFFRVYCGRIVLPTEFDRIYSVAVDGVPQQINSPWYELVVGSGRNIYQSQNLNPPPFNNSGITLDRDEVFQFRDIPKDQWYFLKLETQFAEVDGATILFRGWDNAHSPVTTNLDAQWIEGEQMALVSGTKSTSTFSEISGIVKPKTNGEIYVYAVNADETVKVHVGTYAPNDRSPFYRTYKVAGTNGDHCPSCVEVRARRRYQPIEGDNDFVMLGNIPALKKMVQAVWFSDANKPEEYQFYKSAAVDLLRKEATAYRGKNRLPSLTFQQGYAIGGYPNVH